MWDPIIEGCTTSTACNYNPEAKEDDNTCIDPLGCDNWCPGDTTEVKELDCAGVCGGVQFIDCSDQCGLLVIDECGVCGGNNTFCTDCNGIINGSAYKDNCSICVGGNTGLEACTYDCTGYWGGSLVNDECGVCDGENSTCTDCNEVINGTAYIDGCGECVGGDSGLEECDYDCAGELGGDAELDQCGTCNAYLNTNGSPPLFPYGTCDCNGFVNGTAYIDGCQNCVGGNTGMYECTYDCAGVLDGASFYDNCGECVSVVDTACVQGCDGSWVNDGTQAVLDECEVCGGNILTCIDCAGTPNGSAIVDNCEECVSAGDTSCIQGCDGSWVNDGTQAVLDDCEICGGDNTVCAGCDGIPNSGLEIDVCGVCGGDGTCLPENCTDDNESGYCQDLSVLQILIDNSSGTLNMDMDDNGNGVIEPLELGDQTWTNGRLISLNCYNDGLSGEIPSEIGNLTNLTALYLNNNSLTGEIPVEIGNLTNLTSLNLFSNELSGEIPPEIGNLVNLIHLFIFSNGLTGEIPSEIGNLLNLRSLWLSGNQLSGEIPPEIGNLMNLSSLYLHSNELTGEIPNEICDLDLLWNNYIAFQIHDNNLCPPYPSCIEDYVGEQDISDCLIEDIDGNTYEIVQIGDQLWMAENLKVTHYNNGDEIPTEYSNSEWINLSTGAYAIYNDEESITSPADCEGSCADIYGNLYNWYAVDDERGLCMEGWHVPTDAEYTVLTDYLISNNVETTEDNVGSVLAGNSYLWNDGVLVDNSEFGTSGFKAIPAGKRIYNNGYYSSMNYNGYFCSSTEYIASDNAYWLRFLSHGFSQVLRSAVSKNYGNSVRCLVD